MITVIVLPILYMQSILPVFERVCVCVCLHVGVHINVSSFQVFHFSQTCGLKVSDDDDRGKCRKSGKSRCLRAKWGTVRKNKNRRLIAYIIKNESPFQFSSKKIK